MESGSFPKTPEAALEAIDFLFVHFIIVQRQITVAPGATLK